MRWTARWCNAGVPLIVFAAIACGGGGSSPAAPGATAAANVAGSTLTPNWNLRSGAFLDGDPIPKDHTCDGSDRSPHLVWDPAPPRTQSLALLVHDPDAPGGDFTHWIVFNLSPTSRGMEPGQVPTGALQGKNESGKQGYSGPCPPKGPAHRYYFDLYALDQKLALDAGATKVQLQQALAGHTVGQTQLMGKYTRA